jgi:TetR/AcrR family transcriptional repressor of mexJK operon
VTEKLATKRSLSSTKREGIVDAALSAFLEMGYGAASMDEIVRRAGGSKATIYKNFKNKEELFATVVDKLVRHSFGEELIPDEPPEKALLAYAERRLKVVLAEDHNALRRLVIAEGKRFPKIAETYYSHGPALSHKQLTAYFREEKKRGALNIDDPATAAEMFRAMLMHSPYLRALLRPGQQLTATQIKQHARKVVRTFLRLYPPIFPAELRAIAPPR